MFCWARYGYEKLYGAESLRSWQSLSWAKKFAFFMEPEVLLPWSHKPTTGSYRQPDKPNPCS